MVEFGSSAHQKIDPITILFVVVIYLQKKTDTKIAKISTSTLYIEKSKIKN